MFFVQLASQHYTFYQLYHLCGRNSCGEGGRERKKKNPEQDNHNFFFTVARNFPPFIAISTQLLATQLLFICAVFFSQSGWGMAWCRYRVCKNVNKQKKFQLSSIPLPHYKINISTFQVRRGLAVLLFEISFLLF